MTSHAIFRSIIRLRRTSPLPSAQGACSITQRLCARENAKTGYSERVTGLTSLALNTMYSGPPYIQYLWPCDIISSNISTLKTLTIGFEQHAIRAYEATYSLDVYSLPGSPISKNSKLTINTLMACLKRQSIQSKNKITSSIENLRLTSFDLDPTLLRAMGPFIDFSKLVSLRLESCASLNNGLAGLKSTTSLSCLRSLTIRTELVSDGTWPSLEAFICSLIGLTDLCLLMEGDFEDLELENILKRHGQTLRSLVVDTRTGPRLNTAESTSVQPQKDDTESYITDISKHCPGLVELGITLDWQAVISPGSTQEHV